MIFTCPECGVRLRGPKAGTVMACRACGNPVVVPVQPPPAQPAEAPVPAAETRGPRSPWRTAAIVLALVGAAHVALFLLLTMEARSGKSKLEARHGRSALRHAKKPEGESPAPGTPAYEPWRQQYEAWSASRDHARHSAHVGLLRTGLFFSFLVQVGITGWILMRVVGGQRRRPRRAKGASS